MKLSKTWTTVTPLSKTIALILFIALPFIGFYLGYNFKQLTIPSTYTKESFITSSSSTHTVSPTSTPSPNGVAKWSSRRYPNNRSFFINNQDIEIPSSQNIDYLGTILVSPNNDKVCLEWGSSGYRGYVIGVIKTQTLEILLEGSEYSYCQRWLDDNRVVIEEKPYNTSKDNFYIFSTITKEKQLLPEGAN